MSVPSSKTTVTADKPNLEVDRTSIRSGRPLMACSTGVVMNFSTSSGPRAGDDVKTWTCTLVTSGTASMGSLAIATRPPATSTSDAITTMTRFLTDQSRMRSIMVGS
jgi:hypothetical protein